MDSPIDFNSSQITDTNNNLKYNQNGSSTTPAETTTTTTTECDYDQNSESNHYNCDFQVHRSATANSSNNHNPLSLISKCSQRAFKSDPDSPWTCPSTNSPSPQSNRHSCNTSSTTNNQCLRKREDKPDLTNDGLNCLNDCDDDSMLLDIPPEYARDDIELVVDLYIWFEKVRSFLLGLLC